MSASTNKHVVPWIIRSEFVDVYKRLYSGRSQDQQEALDHITLWQIRCDSHVPLAVTCSADLISAQIEHHLYRDGSAPHGSESRLRQGYTLALIRFVNFITDRYQKDGSNVAIPIHRIGKEIGIPEWIVSLRHEGTHRALPTLDVLARGAEWSIQWLKDSFWEKQIPGRSKAQCDIYATGVKSQRSKLIIKGTTRKLKSYKKIQFQAGESEFPVTSSDMLEIEGETVNSTAHLLVAFQQIRFQELAGRTFRIDDLETGTEGCQVLLELRKLLSFSADKTLDVLIQPGYLRPSMDQLCHMGLDPNKCSHEKMGWVIAIFWRPLLHEINKLRITSCLIERLVSTVNGDSSHWNKLTHIWIRMLVSPYTISFPSGRSTLLFHHQVAVSELPLLQQCLQHPNIFTNELLKAFASRANALLTHTAVERLSELLQIYLQDPASSEGGITGKNHSKVKVSSKRGGVQLFSVEDILHAVQDTEIIARQPRSQWRPCVGNMSWRYIPVGILPGQDIDSLYHDLQLGGKVMDDSSRMEKESSTMEEQMETELESEPSISTDNTVTGKREVRPIFSWSRELLDVMQNKVAVL